MMKEIKCVVWDLDHTLWDGVLLESERFILKPEIINIIKELDQRGILQSIASKNNHDDAMRVLEKYSISEYFLYPEINWNAKSTSLYRICNNLNIDVDSILFIDDQEFERDEVKEVHPTIQVFDSKNYLELIKDPRLNPRFITEDSKRRRQMYIENIKRVEAEENYKGPSEDFLASLVMKFTISEAQIEDLKRAEELTIRTNQLNTTGRTYSYEELKSFIESENHKVLVCELEDRYGSYGKIGLTLIETRDNVWYIKLLLMSCRVMSRGVGKTLLTFIMDSAKKNNKGLYADFKKTNRNKMMLITYKFANFKEVSQLEDGTILFENNLDNIQPIPEYINLVADI
ncbi:HAD-IIIC family phosphatase [Bacillus thuringiensis]|uniref:HAD-IIIC family phosphatase n=1 Tax=Bacillus tropicus TaxID=2026188 RepID=UPI0035D6627D